MRTITVTGSAGGMGSALRDRLEGQGDQVIGDLSTAAGREKMVAAVTDASGGELDGLVVAAGITHDDGAPVVAIDYFGAIATLDGLRPLLAARPRSKAVVVGSNSCST